MGSTAGFAFFCGGSPPIDDAAACGPSGQGALCGIGIDGAVRWTLGAGAGGGAGAGADIGIEE